MVSFIEHLKQLVECESPSHDLDACNRIVDIAISISNQLNETPARKTVQNGRPIFWWGSPNPKIMILAHLDTVWPIGSFNPKWSVENDVARGPGIFDMKSGFMQGLYALKEIPGAEKEIALIATTDEEIESPSSRELIERTARNASVALVLEPSIDGKLKTSRKGSSQYQISVHGLAAHAGLEPDKGVNATVEVSRIVSLVIRLGNATFGTTVTPTVLHSGTTTNTIPSLATLHIDCRSFEMTELERVDGYLRSLTPHTEGAHLAVMGGISRRPLDFKSSEKLYKRFEEVARQLNHETVGHAAVGGVSDGNLTAAMGTPTLDGLGAVGNGAHASTEHIVLSSIGPRIELLKAFLSNLLSDF